MLRGEEGETGVRVGSGCSLVDEFYLIELSRIKRRTIQLTHEKKRREEKKREEMRRKKRKEKRELMQEEEKCPRAFWYFQFSFSLRFHRK